MSVDSLGQTLHESFNNPELWLRQAEQQFLVATAIAPNIEANALTETDTLLCAGYGKTTMLLLALAVENALKAIKAAEKKFEVDDKGNGIKRKSMTGGSSGHELLSLAKGAGLSQEQEMLLVKLTQIGVWAGKYHAPISYDAFDTANAVNPRSLSLPMDFNEVRKILCKAAAISKVSSCLT